MSDSDTISGSCYCSATSFRISRPAENLTLSSYCHCSRCQRLNGAPFIWTTHWKAPAVTWSYRGEPVKESERKEQPQRYEVVEGVKYRLRCSDCGTPIGTWNERKQEWSLWPTSFSSLRDPSTNRLDLSSCSWLKADSHMFYGTRVLDITGDGVDKWLGYPGKSERFNETA